MKTKILFFALLGFNLNFGQALTNQSITNVLPAITTPISAFGSEIFRFRSGLVTQIDAGSNFGFTNSRWFALGSLNTGSQTVYGLRFQLPNKAITFGYNNITNNNPRIEWIGTGANLGNLEFRVADSFGAPGAPAVTKLVATMTSAGNTYFGNPALFVNNEKVGIEVSNSLGLLVKSSGTLPFGKGIEIEQTSGTNFNLGLSIICENGSDSTQGILVKSKGRGSRSFGVFAAAIDGAREQYGLYGVVDNSGTFGAGVYGRGRPSNVQWAGYFDGNVFTTGSYLPSDSKLKNNIKPETSVLEKLALLKPVTYDYKKMEEMNLSIGLQHGFISQELATVFPELTIDVTKPIFDKEGKSTGMYDFKGINYNGLISVLTAAVNELNAELKNVKEELSALKNISVTKSENSKVIMEQNIPNPFSDQTTIRYQLSTGDNAADIMVLDLNGKMIKTYPIVKNTGEITIKSAEIGSGLFIYTLVQNGQSLITKKMIIK